MNLLFFIAALAFSSPAFARPDEARLSGNPLPGIDLELASVLFDRRAEVEALYSNTLGFELKFTRGGIARRIEAGALISVFTLETALCSPLATPTCQPTDSLVIERHTVQERRGLVTSFAPLARRAEAAAGDPLSVEALLIAAIFVNQRSAIAERYAGPGYGDAGFWLARGTEVVSRPRPGTTITTYSFEVKMRGRDAPNPESGYWVNTLQIEEEAVTTTNGTTKTYRIGTHERGLG